MTFIVKLSWNMASETSRSKTSDLRNLGTNGLTSDKRSESKNEAWATEGISETRDAKTTQKIEKFASMPGSTQEMEGGTDPNCPSISRTIDINQRYRAFWRMHRLAWFPLQCRSWCSFTSKIVDFETIEE
jgi:hypothetical protein